MSSVSRELVAASAQMIILSILSQDENYGYQILQRIKSLTEGIWIWKDGMLYPLLHKMEKEKLIESYWLDSESGKKRKYYFITKNGIQALQLGKKEWKFVDATLNKLWGMQSC